MDSSQLRTRAFLFATTMAAAFSFLACSPQRSQLKSVLPEKSGSGLQPQFSELKKMVFDPKCLSCHTSGTTNLTSRITLLAGTSVVPGFPEQSPLYRRVADGTMPQGGSGLDPDQVAMIFDWIAGGAMDDAPGTQQPQPPPIVSNELKIPEALTAIALSSTQVQLMWTDTSDSEDGFKIERSQQPDTGFVQVAIVAQNSQAYLDDGLLGGETYYYQVRAVNSQGESAPSNVSSAMLSP